MTLGGVLWRQRPFPGNQVRPTAVRCVLQDPSMRLIGGVNLILAQRAMHVHQLEHTYATTKPHARSLNKKRAMRVHQLEHTYATTKPHACSLNKKLGSWVGGREDGGSRLSVWRMNDA